ncbi:RNA polymerase sigma factor SigY [Paenibacillus mesotrionivorans]|uniref:RNA polymerase sigma factor SigY n=1 Tax=Paenibacillus mesotrionivorans TaxID=3160968 RepID=A0ACC7P522_9BACL
MIFLQDGEESRLIEQAGRGDKQAMQILLQTHYTFLVKYLVKITLQPYLAEDLAQETMLRCMEKIRLYNGKSRFSTWMMTIASRLFIDYTRKQKRERFLLEQEQAVRKLKWQAQQMEETGTEIWEALAALDEEHRVSVILKHYYGYAYEEIGEILGIPAGTVKSRVHNGVRALRKELEA